MNKEKPICVGTCKTCNNPIYNWDGDSTPRKDHNNHGEE